MSKGQITRTHILKQSAQLFNLKGYAGSSMADLMRVTGLKKGGIYNHFSSKDDLALASFDYAIAQIQERQRQLLKGKRLTRDRLYALVDGFYGQDAEAPVFSGGCPLFNTAVEADDAHPVLKAKAKGALVRWHELLSRIVRLGQKRGEVLPEIDPNQVATIIISMLEGAIMMNNLADDSPHLQVAVEHLLAYIDRCCVDKN